MQVGFQTHLDRQTFVELVGKHLYTAKIVYDHKIDIHAVTLDGWSCSLGVFPVSIKNEEYLTLVHDADIQKQAESIRNEVWLKGRTNRLYNDKRGNLTIYVADEIKMFGRRQDFLLGRTL